MQQFRSDTVKDVDVHSDIPIYQNMDKYLSVKLDCVSDHRIEHDIVKEMKECSTYLTQVKSVQIIDRADGHDPQAIIELAVRFISGCAMRKQSVEGAPCSLDAITYPTREAARSSRKVTPPELVGQAYSLAAHAQYHKFIASPAERQDIETDEHLFCRSETRRLGCGQPPLTSLTLAAHDANGSVKLGLVSHAVLTVGITLQDLGESFGVDVTMMPEGAKKFRPLWREVARCKDGGGFACAAEGCDVRSEQKSALRSCAGKCPTDVKPSYCSKGCQKKDWPRHKLICKPGITGKIPKVTDKAKVLELLELGDELEEELQVQEDERTDAELEALRAARRSAPPVDPKYAVLDISEPSDVELPARED
ncbi:hypothetical protein L226DRAFT_536569 [Lentinus tigrinus ALCF2SS1-7]|uniref:MYND-type domain-containing protein n=1 Tax=Lentinus tigrinus ALCF2SS1-6 TaxID=1328759 RepID=A0A5C2S1B0_9APHY|nr:hypothetical protein L227DRAFT_578181 [Lentinus tigrinus ALCF2SS1-6]RPD73072.1 hypothetical protein L226DRAFT_536569 [Lentinus tigrinus ALCF2SS1-7]